MVRSTVLGKGAQGLLEKRTAVTPRGRPTVAPLPAGERSPAEWGPTPPSSRNLRRYVPMSQEQLVGAGSA
jgi:hypothetical protein